MSEKFSSGTKNSKLQYRMNFSYMNNRAVSISYETNVTFPNSPYLDKFTVMGVVIVAENL